MVHGHLCLASLIMFLRFFHEVAGQRCFCDGGFLLPPTSKFLTAAKTTYSLNGPPTSLPAPLESVFHVFGSDPILLPAQHGWPHLDSTAWLCPLQSTSPHSGLCSNDTSLKESSLISLTKTTSLVLNYWLSLLCFFIVY